ncbi:hypothetical protein DAERI_020261 [Deinococcus aerius]|uniref:Uncharacterized protein n=2 Tax=Deinococcus TaxID=1298 RepID=A0A2I9CSM5_9DEIO|nr:MULTISPECIES: hypothetical protein [Deinococcus]MBB5293875.1 hypothetical protein [Deinococcus metallilatus]QBY07178.1 hypothetical protein E5F05_04135 [Deinococcus metallilatus]RXJ14650.1 hypothetical protein ERJ73_02865 [Deinococcus metallilatus]TLK30770.1 hypothetical protein FCS05_03180 [Deinococcus metallilatus]GBF04664.1 hypothetical protein DAERI_020261 [Deinococcus aerius]
MVIELTTAYEAWFQQVNEELAAAPSRNARVKPTVENIESGAVDFKALAEETRRRLNASLEKGQTLAKSCAQQRKSRESKPARGRTMRAKN